MKISIIVLSQNLFFNCKFFRVISLNVPRIVLFRMCYINQISCFGKNFFDEDPFKPFNPSHYIELPVYVRETNFPRCNEKHLQCFPLNPSDINVLCTIRDVKISRILPLTRLLKCLYMSENLISLGVMKNIFNVPLNPSDNNVLCIIRKSNFLYINIYLFFFNRYQHSQCGDCN